MAESIIVMRPHNGYIRKTADEKHEDVASQLCKLLYDKSLAEYLECPNASITHRTRAAGYNIVLCVDPRHRTANYNLLRRLQRAARVVGVDTTIYPIHYTKLRKWH